MKRKIALLLTLALAVGAFTGALADWGSDWGTTTGTTSYTVSATTPLYNASSGQLTNINLASGAISGKYLSAGQRFSFNDIVGPRTADEGYKMGVNGRGARVRGGGVSQVATTIMLALRQIGNVTITDMSVYGDKFTENYVASGEDAVITDYANKRDFCFVNMADDMKIDLWVSTSYLYCSVTVYTGGGQSSTPGTLIGYSSTPVSGTNTLKNNIRLASDSINGTQLGYYSEFSFNGIVGPRDNRYGYGTAINGRGVKVVGGGVAQVASTVYMAIKNLNCVKITSLRTYGDDYNQSYVSNKADAVVTDYNANIDFAFRYNGYGALTVLTYLNSSGTRLICEVYERTNWQW